MGEGLARVAAGEDVDGLVVGQPREVDLGDVTEVGHAGVVGREHLHRCGLDVGDPREVAAHHGLHGDVEAAVAGEEGADPHCARTASIIRRSPMSLQVRHGR